ncbi:DUF6301 family protein [Nocardia sp. NPDC127526]|uniref:DUF6301 family protein n=1 Tax=Nocardia sp. NPDC127526 TaxID=3345393 RepID=UPI00362D6B74
MTGWDEFAERLAEQLTALPDGAIVTIGGNRPSGAYVQSQVVQLEDGIWGEFLGDALIQGDSIDADPEVMTDVGWQPPGNADHGKNWWIELPWPVPSAIYRRLATMIVTGFREYHRFPDTSALSYHAWNSIEGNRPIELHLGLPRAPDAAETASGTTQSEPAPTRARLPEGVRLPDWTVLEPDEIMALATKLIALDPAWRFDPNLVAGTFGWPMRTVAPNYFQLDTGPETAKGYLWTEAETQGLEVPISMPVPDDDEQRLDYVFTLLSPTLSTALGPSALPPSTRPDEITWANDTYRLDLMRMPVDIRLFLTPR